MSQINITPEIPQPDSKGSVGDSNFHLAKRILQRSGSLQALLNDMNKDDIVNLVNLRDSRGLTLLHLAVDMNNEAAVKELLDCGAHVEAEANDKSKPLHYARSVDIAKLLLNSNAEIDAKDSKGKTILYYAYLDGNVNLARLLLKRKADFADARRYCNLRSNCSEVEFLVMMMFEDYDQDMIDDIDADEAIWLNNDPIYD